MQLLLRMLPVSYTHLKMISNYGAWNEYLKDEFKKDYFVKMKNFLNEEYKNKTIFPPNECVFTIFDKISPKDIKVIILGQDPYHLSLIHIYKIERSFRLYT